MSKRKKPRVVIVTGLSGSGLSTALNALQDNGFYCIDNLPFLMLSEAIAMVCSGALRSTGFAFGMDIRDKQFAIEFPQMKKNLSKKVDLDVLYLAADESVILSRYGSTRRKHPLLENEESLLKAVQCEEELLIPVRRSADHILDTSLWTAQMLQRNLEHRYLGDVEPRVLYVTLSSFGFKHGMLRPAESIFDVRFVTNPYFVKELRDHDGREDSVQKFIFKDKIARDTLSKLDEFYRFFLPKYHSEGKHFFRIGIGCTGGKHRSVAFVEKLAQSLAKKPVHHVIVNVVHRDIEISL